MACSCYWGTQLAITPSIHSFTAFIKRCVCVWVWTCVGVKVCVCYKEALISIVFVVPCLSYFLLSSNLWVLCRTSFDHNQLHTKLHPHFPVFSFSFFFKNPFEHQEFALVRFSSPTCAPCTIGFGLFCCVYSPVTGACSFCIFLHCPFSLSLPLSQKNGAN